MSRPNFGEKDVKRLMKLQLALIQKNQWARELEKKGFTADGLRKEVDNLLNRVNALRSKLEASGVMLPDRVPKNHPTERSQPKHG